MTFNPTVFERLLFPLNRRVYRQIQEALDTIEEKHPGKLRQIIEGFGEAARSDTQTPAWRPGKAGGAAYPSLDVSIVFGQKPGLKIATLRKSTGYEVRSYYKENPPSEFRGSHLVVGFHQGKTLHSFIAPLGYLLGFDEKKVLREGSHQLYSHTVTSPDNQAIINQQLEAISEDSEYGMLPSVQEFHQKNSLVYVGITRRTWQERYRQHCRDMGRGSNLLFHRALRGEFCAIACIEHIVERAGLTERQAMEMEEREVEGRSLRSLHPNGLNMIPGGYAGLKCVHHYAARTGYAMKGEIAAEDIESVLVDVQRHLLEKQLKTDDIARANAEIARLWAEDINFRIRATTGQQNRFSFRQIQAARTWHASGWPPEKILECLQKMDSRGIGMDQLDRLLRGETYASIPDVLI